MRSTCTQKAFIGVYNRVNMEERKDTNMLVAAEAVLARKMVSYMTRKNHQDTSVQKGGVPGLSGCVEHTSFISQLIREAKTNKRN